MLSRLIGLAQLEIDKIIPRLFYPGIAIHNTIKDEFTALPISRQRKYQLRMQREGRCRTCGEPTSGGHHCLKHLVGCREKSRKRRGSKGRWKHARSYTLEQEIKLARQQQSKK